LIELIHHGKFAVIIEIQERTTKVQTPKELRTTKVLPEAASTNRVTSGSETGNAPPTHHQNAPPKSVQKDRSIRSKTQVPTIKTHHQNAPQSKEVCLEDSLIDQEGPFGFYKQKLPQHRLDTLGNELLHPLRLSPADDRSGFLAGVAFLHGIQELPDVRLADLQSMCGVARENATANPIGYFRTSLRRAVPDFDQRYKRVPRGLRLSVTPSALDGIEFDLSPPPPLDENSRRAELQKDLEKIIREARA
jgi:hypothetical protein